MVILLLFSNVFCSTDPHTPPQRPLGTKADLPSFQQVEPLPGSVSKSPPKSPPLREVARVLSGMGTEAVQALSDQLAQCLADMDRARQMWQAKQAKQVQQVQEGGVFCLS